MVSVPVAGSAQANKVDVPGFVVFGQGQVWPFAQRFDMVYGNSAFIHCRRFVCAIPATAALVF